MNPSSRFDAGGDSSFEVAWEDGERVFCRGWRLGGDGQRTAVLAVLPALENPSPASLARLTCEYDVKDELDGDWAVRPLELVCERSRTMLVLEDPGGEPLERLLGAPMEVASFLRLAIGTATALGKAHQHGLVHKDIKPGNIIINCASGEIRLTGFGIATRLPRERQSPDPPETIAGTLAYMAPEQTGRMNRSVDCRSDLYSLGITLYQMLTGSLPFTANDPMEWIHCHIARMPVPPSEGLGNVPAAISQVIMKLLAKTAEERYQTAAGVERDLRRSLAAWEAQGRIDDFPLGEHDAPDRLFIPEKLYGREREIETVLTVFDRITKGGGPELVLVSGYSGIGKSSVVNELHKVIVPPRGLFASGKFDQYKRDIPYSTLVQAFQSLVRPLLGKSDTELARWRSAFLEALDPNARLMTDLIPELKLIIGDQPPVPELDLQQAQSRFQLVFRRFIGVFARPEHPLALFLDDLQWLDAATLDLLEDLLRRSDLQYLMLIGAYRDNEVDAVHPLTRTLDAIRQTGARVQDIRLSPLARDDLGQLIADAIRCNPERVAALAQLVYEKTAGNPFFVIQFLYSLSEEGLIRFDHAAGCWSWDVGHIRAKRYTDNVVDLMVGKLTRLPTETQQALQQLACLGNVAATETLSTVLAISEEQVRAALWLAVRQELVERLDGSYRFIHDRVQEAAYSLIPEVSRAEAHLRIGRLLLTHTPPGQREEAIFEIVNQLNRGAALITHQEERDLLAELNLIAGKRAKGATAYASALTYLSAGAVLLPVDSWDRQHELMFALELNRAECEFLTGQTSTAEERLLALSKRAKTTVERAKIACLHMDVCTNQDQAGRAVAVCLDYLRHVGVEWSPHPTDEEVRREYERIWSLLGKRTIEELIDLPTMEDAATLATVDVLIKVLAPAWYTDANLASVTSCRATSLSIERGNCDASCVAYVLLGRIAGWRFGDYQAGFRFGQLGYELVERRGLKRFQANTYHFYAVFVVPWIKHVRHSHDLLRRGFEAANRNADLLYGAYTCHNLNSGLLFAGEPLPKMQNEVEQGLAFTERARLGLVIDIIATQLALTRMLRGLTPKFGRFDDGGFNEFAIEQRLSGNPALAIGTCWYWIRKMQARYMAEDFAEAMDALSNAQRLLWVASSHFEEAEYHFWGAMTRAAFCGSSSPGVRRQHIDAVAAHHKQLKVWAKNCPENFEHRAALVGAELARNEGRDVEAMRLYEQAIRSARANDFVQNEALAYEVAARFYATRGFEDIAHLYLRKARYCYLRWGADGKVRQLEEMYPHLRTEEPAPGPTSTIATPVERLDLATVIKLSQAVSGEMVLDRLIDTLMRTAITQAGAERGLLILAHAAEPRVTAEATTSGDAVVVQLRDVPVTASLLPETILHHVLRTRESMILDDAAADPSLAADPYIRGCQARSVLCLPLINQAKLIGVLYVENNLTPRAFAPNRIAVLKLLASQAAISLENARLYGDLAQREVKIRRLVEAAQRSELELRDVIESVPAIAWTAMPDGSNVFANRRWVEYTGLTAQDTAGSGWEVAVHPEDSEQYARKWSASLTTGEPFEAEVRVRNAVDGKYRWFLARAVPLRDAQGNILRWYGILTDIEDRKRAEALLAGEKRILEMVAKGDSLSRVIDSLCRLVEEHTPDALASVLLIEDGRMKHVGNPSLPRAFVEAIDGIAIGPTAGSCGTAAYFARRVIVSDIASDPLWEDYRDLALPHSLRAAWSTPIMSSEGKVIGTFAMYYREPRSPSPRDQEIVEQITHLAGIAIQRTRLYRDLEQREAKIRRLVDANIIGVFVGDFDGRIIEANDAFLRIVGYDCEDLISGRMNVVDMTPPEWRDRTARTIAEIERVRTVQPYEKEYFRKDGSRVPVLVGAAAFEERGDQGVAFVLDLTEHKRAEKALRESEEQWKAVFENNPTMYFMVDKGGAILSVNPLGAEQLGFTVDELIGRPVLDLFHVEDREAVNRKTAVCFELRGQPMSWEARKIHNNGSMLWVRETARVMLIKDRPVALIACEDITERKRVGEALQAVQMELAHANRVATMGQLTASIAHEVNQPIGAARNHAASGLRFLFRNPPDLDEVREALERVVINTNRAGEIIGRIRALVKKERPRCARFEINDAIEELIALVRSKLVESGATVRICLAEDLRPIQGDRVQLQQVVLNLIMNAVEAMSSVDDAPRDLAISTAPGEAGEVLVAVRDSGPGIDPEHLGRVFDSFYTTKPSGMGLGLSICRSIIDAHGGRLWADANKPRGAVFQFTLPPAKGDS